jgi:hypothetical protein
MISLQKCCITHTGFKVFQWSWLPVNLSEPRNELLLLLPPMAATVQHWCANSLLLSFSSTTAAAAI